MPSAGQTTKPLVRLPRDANGCWEWLAGVNSSAGCAVKTIDRKTVPAARWMWATLFGIVPAGLVISHACGNKLCVNPAHLRCTTQADANRASHTVTLTPGDVHHIRKARKGKLPQTAKLLAQQYGTHVNTIRDIWRGHSWQAAQPNYGPRREGRDGENQF